MSDTVRFPVSAPVPEPVPAPAPPPPAEVAVVPAPPSPPKATAPVPYDPADWYWTVAGDESRVWSSGLAAYVPATAPAYLAWRAAGGWPSRIVSEAELAAVLAAQFPAGWPAAPVTILTPLAFRARFTAAELAAIQTAALGNAALLGWLLEAAAAQVIDLDDQKTKDGLAALVAASLVTAARATAILTP